MAIDKPGKRRSFIALRKAFLATTYRACLPGGAVDLRIGAFSAPLAAFLACHEENCWGIVTACNPGGIRSDERNAGYASRLLLRVRGIKCPFFPAINLADDALWPEERGVFILGADEKSLRSLAAEFAQLAFVCGDASGVPRLLWTNPGQA